MLVKNWMSTPVISVNADDSMQEAVDLLRRHTIQILPVMERGRLVGVVTDRDLRRASASDATALEAHELQFLILKIKVRDIMSKDPVSVPVDFTVEETAEVLLAHGISGVPVLDEGGKVVGIITKTDVFRLLISLTGVGKRGIQFAFRLEDRSGSIKEVADIIRAFGGRMVSILSSYEQVPEGYRKVYIRAYDLDRNVVPRLTAGLREKASLLYVVDHREDARHIYEQVETPSH